MRVAVKKLFLVGLCMCMYTYEFDVYMCRSLPFYVYMNGRNSRFYAMLLVDA